MNTPQWGEQAEEKHPIRIILIDSFYNSISKQSNNRSKQTFKYTLSELAEIISLFGVNKKTSYYPNLVFLIILPDYIIIQGVESAIKRLDNKNLRPPL